MYLHHYFNKENGPFLSISDLPADEARKAIDKMASYITEKSGRVYKPEEVEDEFIINRHKLRRDLENKMRQKFIEKNGKVSRNYPYYMILTDDYSPDEALKSFYRNGDYISIPVEELNMNTISFTYGDSFAQYYHSEADNKLYKNVIYTFEEILEVIKEYGWVKKNENNWGFVEAHLWNDEQISKYR